MLAAQGARMEIPVYVATFWPFRVAPIVLGPVLHDTVRVAPHRSRTSMPVVNFFVSNAAQVSSHRRLVFFVDSPPREMQILSGIVRPSWDSQNDFDVEEVNVHFEQDAPPGNYPNDWTYTATTSLAGLNSEGEDFTFTADECELRVWPANNELYLWAKIGVLGNPAVLRTFSYHIEVLSNLPIQGMIFGTIRWSADIGAPTNSGPSPMFNVGPATYTPPPPLGGGG